MHCDKGNYASYVVVVVGGGGAQLGVIQKTI